MGIIYDILHGIYIKVYRHCFKTNAYGYYMFQDLDDLIGYKDTFVDYIEFEYFLAIIYNAAVSVPSLYYFYLRHSVIMQLDYISAIWLLTVNIIKLIEIIPKSIILYLCFHITNNSSDSIVVSRRLMYMTRTNIFFYNSICGYILLGSYTLYFLFIKRPSYIPEAPQFYYIINWLIFGFFIRLTLSFINYFLHFKYGINEADLNNNLYQDFTKCVPTDVLSLIECHTLTKENIDKYVSYTEEKERDCCCICMMNFSVGDVIRLLPCNSKHVFHKACIDKWFSHNKACPTCRKEITKKLIKKNKIY